MAATNFCGRLAGGVLIDRLSSRRAFAVFPLFAAGGMVLGLAFPGSSVAAVGMLLGTMLTFGLITPAIAVALSRQVGEDLFARAYGVIFFAWGLAGLTAPWLAGLLYDLTGGYAGALRLGLACALAAAAAGLGVPPDPPAAPDGSAQ
jgi:predicted MFS family arabinose efflux permease